MNKLQKPTFYITEWNMPALESQMHIKSNFMQYVGEQKLADFQQNSEKFKFCANVTKMYYISIWVLYVEDAIQKLGIDILEWTHERIYYYHKKEAVFCEIDISKPPK